MAATIARIEPKKVTWSVTQAPCIKSGSNSPIVHTCMVQHPKSAGIGIAPQRHACLDY
jgi:hypothetical protein